MPFARKIKKLLLRSQIVLKISDEDDAEVLFIKKHIQTIISLFRVKEGRQVSSSL